MLVSLAEMSMSSDLGLKINKPKNLKTFMNIFGEDQGRYLIEVSKNNLKTMEVFLKKITFFMKL